MTKHFFIGDLSDRAGVSPQTIRYYERIKLLDPPDRTETRYRLYTENDQARLQFIRQAKVFGLSLAEIKSLIDLRIQGTVPCDRLRRLVKNHLHTVNLRIQEMIELRNDLQQRYEAISEAIDDAPGGTICGLIEQEKIGDDPSARFATARPKFN